MREMKTRIVLLWSLLALIRLTGEVTASQENRNPAMPLRDAGNATITGRVMLPSGVMNSSHLKIVLGNIQAPMTTLYSDKNGEFSFSNLPAGTYYVQVFADESLYEPLSHKVKLNPGEPAYIVLHLKEKTTPVARTSHGNMISTAEAQQSVPAAARKAFDSAHKLLDKGNIDGAII